MWSSPVVAMSSSTYSCCRTMILDLTMVISPLRDIWTRTFSVPFWHCVSAYSSSKTDYLPNLHMSMGGPRGVQSASLVGIGQAVWEKEAKSRLVFQCPSSLVINVCVRLSSTLVNPTNMLPRVDHLSYSTPTAEMLSFFQLSLPIQIKATLSLNAASFNIWSRLQP